MEKGWGGGGLLWRRDGVQECWGVKGMGCRIVGVEESWGGGGLGWRRENLQYMRRPSILLAGDRICNWQPTFSISVYLRQVMCSINLISFV